MLLRRRSMKNPPAAAAINASAPSATPTPIPIFAPWLRPLLGVGVVVAAVGAGDGVEVGDGVVGSGVVLPPLGLVFDEEGFPVAWLHVTGFWLLSITTLKFPLRA